MSNGNRNDGSTSPQLEVLTLEQVADWLQIKPREVVRLGVPCARLGHRTLRFVKAEVVKWLQEKTQQKGR